MRDAGGSAPDPWSTESIDHVITGDRNTMGAWGPNAFDNDAACDWAYELDADSGLELVKETLESVTRADNEYLDADRGSEALAACEVLARLQGNAGSAESTEAVEAWVRSQSKKPGPELIALAERAIEQMLGENSELRDLWEGSEEWPAAVADLKRRLRG